MERLNHLHFLFSYFRVEGEDVRLMLWDTAGQEEFDAITKAYYRGMINPEHFFFQSNYLGLAISESKQCKMLRYCSWDCDDVDTVG